MMSESCLNENGLESINVASSLTSKHVMASLLNRGSVHLGVMFPADKYLCLLMRHLTWE